MDTPIEKTIIAKRKNWKKPPLSLKLAQGIREYTTLAAKPRGLSTLPKYNAFAASRGIEYSVFRRHYKPLPNITTIQPIEPFVERGIWMKKAPRTAFYIKRSRKGSKYIEQIDDKIPKLPSHHHDNKGVAQNFYGKIESRKEPELIDVTSEMFKMEEHSIFTDEDRTRFLMKYMKAAGSKVPSIRKIGTIDRHDILDDVDVRQIAKEIFVQKSRNNFCGFMKECIKFFSRNQICFKECVIEQKAGQKFDGQDIVSQTEEAFVRVGTIIRAACPDDMR